MFSKKDYVIVAISSSHHELLHLSLPALSKIKQKIFLVLHNANPYKIITRTFIRSLGYRGPLKIFNDSVADILSEISTLKIKSGWMILVNEGDILKNVEIPAACANNFAIIQNAELIKRGIATNQILRPYAEIYGTLFRTEFVLKNGIENLIMADANPIYMDSTNYIKVEL